MLCLRDFAGTLVPVPKSTECYWDVNLILFNDFPRACIISVWVETHWWLCQCLTLTIMIRAYRHTVLNRLTDKWSIVFGGISLWHIYMCIKILHYIFTYWSSVLLRLWMVIDLFGALTAIMHISGKLVTISLVTPDCTFRKACCMPNANEWTGKDKTQSTQTKLWQRVRDAENTEFIAGKGRTRQKSVGNTIIDTDYKSSGRYNKHCRGKGWD